MEQFKEIEISKIKTLENVRTNIKDTEIQDLMQNIKQQGLLQPIGVWISNKENIIAYGNRRLAACKKLGWKTITAKILGNLTYEEMLLVNTSENLHRKENTIAEIGRICKLLNDKGLSNGEIAIRLGLKDSAIRMAASCYHSIPAKHRGDIVLMKPGVKNKGGKIPMSIFNGMLSIRRENNLNTAEFDRLLTASKMNNLSLSQTREIATFIKSGASIHQALNKLNEFNIRRITLPINKKVEQTMIKENSISGADKIRQLFEKILSGEIKGNKNLKVIRT